MSRRIWIGLAAAVVVVVGIAAVVVFSGGDSTSSASASDADAFQACLADHGIEGPGGGMPGGVPPTGGQPPTDAVPPSGSGAPEIPSGGAAAAPDEGMQQAFEDCSQYAPDGGPPSMPPG